MLNRGVFLLSVCILDYGSGNVKSVKNAFDRIGVDTVVSNSVEAITKASHIVLPGVGAFGTAMERVQEKIPLFELKKEVLENRKPFLGICVGMQVLAEWGEEHGRYKGLGWLQSSKVYENVKQVRQPHIGWNSVSILRPSAIFEGFQRETDFYFVHSYILHTEKKEVIIGTTNYGVIFPSIIEADNIYGVQFHPEKSQHSGLKLLKNFALVV